MSERAAAFGTLNPPRVIEFNGKSYTVAPVLTEGTLLRLEERMYQRAKEALKGARDLYTAEEYAAEVGALRKRYEAGAFGFTNPDTMKHIETNEGAALLLSAMLGADAGEALQLLVGKEDEVREAITEALELSFPKTRAPRPAAKVRGKKRRRR